MRIAIMGIRGIPARYGGYETLAEELAPRLVERGHEVTVYGRSGYVRHSGEDYRGVELVVLPAIAHKYLETVSHSLLCALHALTRRYDAVLVCNSANAYCSWIPRVRRARVVLNVDGLEWQRAKWNRAGRWFYRASEWLATFLPNAIVSDAQMIHRYYLERFGRESTLIAYGAPSDRVSTTATLKVHGLEPGEYVLYVSRLEPENNAHVVISAFADVETTKKCAIVGDAPYARDYIEGLKATDDSRVVFTGAVYGSGYRELQSHAYLYVQATQVGGTHPALVEAMGYGNCVLANDVPEHREVLADAGIYYDGSTHDDLSAKMQELLDDEEAVIGFRDKARERARAKYSWDSITACYEELLRGEKGG